MCRNKRNLKKEQRNNKMIELKGKKPNVSDLFDMQ